MITQTLGPLASKIAAHTALSPEEVAALAAMVTRPFAVSGGAMLAAAGEPLDVATVLIDGMLARSKFLPDGRRQILSLLVPGDVVDAYPTPLRWRDDSLEAISDAQVAIVPHSRVQAVGAEFPRLHQAFLRETFIEAAIVREWLLNVGGRTAPEALAHLLCEIVTRFELVRLATDAGCPFPLRQQDLADALGLSLIHVNRILKELRAERVVEISKRQLVVDRPKLMAMAKFKPDYLHIRQPTAA